MAPGSYFYNESPISSEKYLYDGWNLAAIIGLAPGASAEGYLRSYLWGPDVSGTMRGAGGVGGLLLCMDHLTGQSHFPTYDGNGNVMALIHANPGSAATVDAVYEYDPFGRTLRANGPAAEGNPFRFSTKFTDEETGLVYYGFRYYSPVEGRWLGRDPLGESGGRNLYRFCLNGAVSNIDNAGLTVVSSSDGFTSSNSNHGPESGPQCPQLPVRSNGTGKWNPGDLEKFINRLKKDKEAQNPCDCTKDLDLQMHGSASSLMLGNDGDKRTSQNTVITGQQMREFGRRIKESASLCKDCEIILSACSIASTDIPSDLHATTGCKIRYQGDKLFQDSDAKSSEDSMVEGPAKKNGFGNESVKPSWQTFPPEVHL